jgi:SAM-dependent methyltransferase
VNASFDQDSLVLAVRSTLHGSLFRSLGRGIDQLEQEFGAAYLADFEAHLALLRASHPARAFPAWPVDGYVAFNRMVLREELRFRTSQAYSATAADLERIGEEIYHNEAVMGGYYLVGLYLTYFIWPHHYRMLTLYRDAFLGPQAGDCGAFAEWGVGHGLFSLAALRRWPQASGALYDLSQHSLDFSEALLGAAGVMGRCSLGAADVLAADLPRVDRLVCSELLEHVADPAGVLRRVRACLNPGGRAFLTAAVNAPQADHVYLFRSEDEVFDMVRAEGLTVREHATVVHPNRQGDATPPAVVGLIAEPA